MSDNTTPVETLLNSKNLQNVMSAMFTKAKVLTTKVRVGSKSSSNIYVPKKHEGKTVTVIIWDE